ncbi:MAG TPA: alpha/beta hydrolase [Gemmatimonadales bacterium]|nr:alpha/beta hydrolase [Gemmatimonadales bacterium]
MLLLIAALLAGDTTTQTIKVAVGRDESLRVVTSGAGEPVVMIPGLFGSAYSFRKMIPLLGDCGYRSVIVEPLGLGFSAKPPKADYSLSAQAERVAAALDSLGVRHAIVLGHSIGGAIALRLALHHPDLVSALVLIESGPTETAVTPAFKRAMRFAPWIKLFGGIGLIRRVVRRSLMSSSGDTTWISEPVVYGYTAGAARDLDATLKVFLAMSASRERDRLQPRLTAITCPVVELVGTAPHHDGDVPDFELDLMQRTLPAFTLDSVRGAGHYLQEEQPQAVLGGVEQARVAAARVERQKPRPP